MILYLAKPCSPCILLLIAGSNWRLIWSRDILDVPLLTESLMSTDTSATPGWAGGEGVGIATRGSRFLLTEPLCRQQEPGKWTEDWGGGRGGEGGSMEPLTARWGVGFWEEGLNVRENIRAAGFAGALCTLTRIGSTPWQELQELGETHVCDGHEPPQQNEGRWQHRKSEKLQRNQI